MKTPNQTNSHGFPFRSLNLITQAIALAPILAVILAALGGGGCGSGGIYPQAGQTWTNSQDMVFVPVKGTKVLFCIWETGVQDFQAYVDAGGLEPGPGLARFERDGHNWHEIKLDAQANWKAPGFTQGPTHPVVGVDWADAQAFCQWLTEVEQRSGKLKSGQAYRLPTTEEMITAVGYASTFRDWTRPQTGGQWPAPDVAAATQNFFPWGNTWPPPKRAGNFADQALKQKYPAAPILEAYADGFAETAPAGSFEPNQYGLYDLAGNVSELMQDQGLESCTLVFGSSWRDMEGSAFVSSSTSGFGKRGTDDVGFRCVLMLSGGSTFAASATAVQRATTEPSYQGRRLSSWLGEIAEAPVQDAAAQIATVDTLQLSFPVFAGELTEPAQAAVRAMGNAALPWLVKDLLATTQGPIPTTDEKNAAAVRGFRALGAAGAPAIPEIAPVFANRDPSWSTSRHCVVKSLEAIGAAAVPVLVTALAHPDQMTRAMAADALAVIGSPAVEAVPALLNALKDPDVNTAAASARALGCIASAPETVVPALIELFRTAPSQVDNPPRPAGVAPKPISPEQAKKLAAAAQRKGKVQAIAVPGPRYLAPGARAEFISRLQIASAQSLASYGPVAAKAAVPELTTYLSQPAPTDFDLEPHDRAVRRAVRQALKVLDPARQGSKP